jgi:hypothetical protein
MSSNPLQQYFRRPVMYFELPSKGKYYDRGTVDIPPNNQLAVYPMTAIDEITARTPDALYNGVALVEIIKSCIPSVKNPWELNSIDLDAITIAIKIASTGEEMDLDTKCPSCEEESRYGINLVNLLGQQHEVDYDDVLQVGDLKIKFKPLTFAEINKVNINQYEIRKLLVILQDYEDTEEQKDLIKQNLKRMNELMTDMIAQTIECIMTPQTIVSDKLYIQEYLLNCDKNVNNLIRDKSVEMKEKNSLKPIDIKCIHCGHEYKQSIVINVVDFFD